MKDMEQQSDAALHELAAVSRRIAWQTLVVGFALVGFSGYVYGELLPVLTSNTDVNLWMVRSACLASVRASLWSF